MGTAAGHDKQPQKQQKHGRKCAVTVLRYQGHEAQHAVNPRNHPDFPALCGKKDTKPNRENRTYIAGIPGSLPNRGQKPYMVGAVNPFIHSQRINEESVQNPQQKSES